MPKFPSYRNQSIDFQSIYLTRFYTMVTWMAMKQFVKWLYTAQSTGKIFQKDSLTYQFIISRQCFISASRQNVRQNRGFPTFLAVYKWNIIMIYHWVKSVRIRSFSCPYFPAFRLNTERYGLSLRIQSECGEIWTKKTPNTNTFNAVWVKVKKLFS